MRDLIARGERAAEASRRLVRESCDIQRVLLEVRLREDSLVMVAIRKGRLAGERRERGMGGEESEGSDIGE